MDKPIYTVNTLMFKNGQETILNIKNFEFHRGACYMINGDMGSGKSLILDILTKNNKKYKGEVEYESENIKSISKNKYLKEIAYVEQNPKKPFFVTVYDYISKIVRSHNDNEKVKKLVNNIFTVMDIKYLKDKKIRSLTPGQFRWVDLAAKIACFPKVLFIDEVENHLSTSKIKKLSKILYRKSNYDGVTIIATTQNKDLFLSMISVNININHGRITSVRSLTKKKKNKNNY